MKCAPVRTPIGSACILALRCGRGPLVGAIAVDREVRAVHAAKIAPIAFVRIDCFGRMIALGVERRRESQNLGRTKFNAKAASLTSLDDYRDGTTCHGTPPHPCPTLSLLGENSRRDVSHTAR